MPVVSGLEIGSLGTISFFTPKQSQKLIRWTGRRPILLDLEVGEEGEVVGGEEGEAGAVDLHAVE